MTLPSIAKNNSAVNSGRGGRNAVHGRIADGYGAQKGSSVQLLDHQRQNMRKSAHRLGQANNIFENLPRNGNNSQSQYLKQQKGTKGLNGHRESAAVVNHQRHGSGNDSRLAA